MLLRWLLVASAAKSNPARRWFPKIPDCLGTQAMQECITKTVATNTPPLPPLYPTYTQPLPHLYPTSTTPLYYLYLTSTPPIPHSYLTYTPRIDMFYPTYTSPLPNPYPTYTPPLPHLYPTSTPPIPHGSTWICHVRFQLVIAHILGDSIQALYEA